MNVGARTDRSLRSSNKSNPDMSGNCVLTIHGGAKADCGVPRREKVQVPEIFSSQLDKIAIVFRLRVDDDDLRVSAKEVRHKTPWSETSRCAS